MPSQTIADLDPDDILAYKKNITNFILNNCSNKLPVKYTDLAEAATDKNMRLLQLVLPEAARALKMIYGLEIFEEPDQKGVKKFICCSTETACSRFELDSEQQRHYALLFFILTYIFCKGGTVDEASLQKILHSFEIDLEQHHEFFGGDLKKLVHDTFVKQLYLKKTVLVSELTNESSTQFSWGFRAEKEFNKNRLREQAAKILGVDLETLSTNLN